MRQTSAIVLVGHSQADPWGSPLARPSHVVELTENSVPGWQVHSLADADGSRSTPDQAGTRAALRGSPTLAHELVVLIATLVLADEDTLARPSVAAAWRQPGHAGGLAIPERGFDGATVEIAAAAVARGAYLWIAEVSDRCSLAQDGSLEALRDWGITTTVLREARSA